ncbi:AMP-binding protein, partial [Rhodococcus sp. LB1]|uniref:AMP-binding protein n=1 Tax=Rhodococcus sp. LB1 TaxID=1807499 RepID=UPI000B1555CE
MSNLSLNLVASARNYPDSVALRCDDLEFTFTEFDAAAARVATFLDHEDIGPGDRVGLMLPNTPAFALAFYGILRSGAIAVPMNPLLKSREIEFSLSDTGATALFATPTFAAEATAGAAGAG